MIKKSTIILLISLIISPIFSLDGVRNGIVDLRGYDFASEQIYDLSGEWLITLENGDETYTYIPRVTATIKGQVKYLLLIQSDKTENLVFAPSQINGEYIITLNNVEVSKGHRRRLRYIPISLKKGVNRLEISVVHKESELGGIRFKPYLGDYKKMLIKNEFSVLTDMVTSGAGFVMFLYFLILFIFYREDKSTLLFSILCFLLFVRGFVTNSKIIYDYYTFLPFSIVNKLEHLTIYLLPVVFLLFIRSFFNRSKNGIWYRTLILISVVFPIITIFSLSNESLNINTIFIIVGILVGVYLLSSLILYMKMGLEDAKYMFVGFLALVISFLHDFFILQNNSNENLILTKILVLFIIYISFIISQKQVKTINRIKTINRENHRVNRYLNKFVPDKFIKTVGMGNISTIKKGDGVERTMTVLFSTIKGFHKQSSLLKGEEVIELLNKYYSFISPIIVKHGGFIDKFMEDTVMALFPDSPESGINAAIDIEKELNQYNFEHIHDIPLKVQSGIHIGKLFIGIVGDDKRFDATVISKVVNTASRIAGFTNKIDKDILISDSVFSSLDPKSEYKTLYMGKVKLKGKKEFIGIHNIYTSKEDEADNLFSMTMRKLENSSLDKIEHVLMNIKKIYKEHTPTLYYLKLIKDNKRLEDTEK